MILPMLGGDQHAQNALETMRDAVISEVEEETRAKETTNGR